MDNKTLYVAPEGGSAATREMAIANANLPKTVSKADKQLFITAGTVEDTPAGLEIFQWLCHIQGKDFDKELSAIKAPKPAVEEKKVEEKVKGKG